MRVLMVLDANDGRGMFRHGYILAKELAQKGNRVTIAYIDPEDAISVEDGVPVHRISGITQKMGFLYAQQNVRHHPQMPDRLVIRKLYRIVKDFRPDVIHVHGWVLYSVACLKRYTNIPIVATLHDYGYFCPTKTLLNSNVICESKSRIECLKCGKKHYGYAKDILTVYGVNRYSKMLKTSVDLFIAVSSYVKERYLEEGFPEKRIRVVHNFYNVAEIEQLNE
ncbi:MAG: glycosyltransferase, partial [Desulfocucumaceae bacterium]